MTLARQAGAAAEMSATILIETTAVASTAGSVAETPEAVPGILPGVTAQQQPGRLEEGDGPLPKASMTMRSGHLRHVNKGPAGPSGADRA